jgi:hypothetical protein
MGSGNNFALLIERENNHTKDHHSGKPLNEFSLSNDEFEILVELERYYPCLSDRDARWRLGIEKEEALYYLRGLKKALDIVVETGDAFRLQTDWQASLY